MASSVMCRTIMPLEHEESITHHFLSITTHFDSIFPSK